MMNDDTTALFKSQLRFFGAIGASLSHEINNAIAIIGELDGLIEDLSVIARSDDRGLDLDKLENIAERIATQVERGKVYAKQLNSFSHSVDDDGAQTLDVSQVVNDVVNLSARFARLSKIEINVGQLENASAVKGDLFDLQHILFLCIELVLCVSEGGSSLGLTLASEGEELSFTFKNTRPAAPAPGISSKVEMIELLANRLGGRVYIDVETPNPAEIALVLPSRLGAVTSCAPEGR